MEPGSNRRIGWRSASRAVSRPLRCFQHRQPQRWHGHIRCDVVPDPGIEHGRDAIIKMTACAICGSDLHLMDGYIPFMEKGDVLVMSLWAKARR